MSRAKSHGRHGHGSAHRTRPKRHAAPGRAGLGGVELAVLASFVGFAVVGAAWMLLGGRAVPLVLAVYLALILGGAALSAVAAARGVRLAWWQRPFARLALRPAGYGTRKGRPIEAAHEDAGARRAATTFAWVCTVLAIALVVGGVVV